MGAGDRRLLGDRIVAVVGGDRLDLQVGKAGEVLAVVAANGLLAVEHLAGWDSYRGWWKVAISASKVLSDTFETAIAWDRFPDFHAQVTDAARRPVAQACGAPRDGPGSSGLSCRFTHVYPDGPAPYYTVICPARRGGEVEQRDEVKAAVSEAVIDGGGTITHHHAVGRDHRPWYERQRPGPFADALRAAKLAVGPAAVLNPGVLVDP